MTRVRGITIICGALMLSALSACGGTKISETCNEAQPYQAIVATERIKVPEGLDPLEEFKEMPVPKAETPPRPEGARCIESPPSVLSGSTDS